MMTWIKALFLPPTPSGPPHLLRAFRAQDLPLDPSISAHRPGEWRIDSKAAAIFPVHEIAPPPLGSSLLAFRAELRSSGRPPLAWLELSCRFDSDEPPLLARGPQRSLPRKRVWEFHEVTLHLPGHLRPDLIRLNIATGGPGRIWFRNLKLLATNAK